MNPHGSYLPGDFKSPVSTNSTTPADLQNAGGRREAAARCFRRLYPALGLVKIAAPGPPYAPGRPGTNPRQAAVSSPP